jgi:hypothetical protein
MLECPSRRRQAGRTAILDNHAGWPIAPATAGERADLLVLDM